MTIRISFELSDSDLKHFRDVMRKAKSAAKHASDDQIINEAKKLLAEVREISDAPHFIAEKLDALDSLIGMVIDDEWKLPDSDRRRALSALAYFSDPEDMIPDDVPGLGFLDDAIMIELVVRELKHEIQAYDDFCVFRDAEEKRRGKGGGDDITREEWLATRRKELQSRMRRRRTRDRSRKRGTRMVKLF